LYFNDEYNCVVRYVNRTTNIISNYAGISPESCYDPRVRRRLGEGLGAATSFSLGQTYGLAFSSSGTLYIGDNTYRTVFGVDLSGEIFIVQGNGGVGCTVSSETYTASFSFITSLAVDSNDDLYISDSSCEQIVKNSESRELVTVYAGGGISTSDDILATSALISAPVSIAIAADDTLCFTASSFDEGASGVIRCVNATTNLISTFAGTNSALYPSTLSDPKGLAIDMNALNMYVVESSAYIITKIFYLTPTSEPTSIPTAMPSLIPTAIPTSEPSAFPTALPTAAPSALPSALPSTNPTEIPTSSPSSDPTVFPTSDPSAFPTSFPSSSPSTDPTGLPTTFPSSLPTTSPSSIPTSLPSFLPTAIPSAIPTDLPSSLPTDDPSFTPSTVPTSSPSSIPTSLPSFLPTAIPSAIPTDLPSSLPTDDPTFTPSADPTTLPSSIPTSLPSFLPTAIPTDLPSSLPTDDPTFTPSADPTTIPSSIPTNLPSALPTVIPTTIPTTPPSLLPTLSPSALPTFMLTSFPSVLPTPEPTASPSHEPFDPTTNPSSQPSESPSTNPTPQPSCQPTSLPSPSPTQPSPTLRPSASPTFITPPPTLAKDLPRITSVLATALSNTTIQVDVTIFSPERDTSGVSGTIVCGASTSSGDASIPTSFRSQSAFTGLESPASLVIGGLRPLRTYFIYCRFVLTSSGFASAISLTSATTQCCIYIPFTNAPAVVYNDLSTYLTGGFPLSSYVFSFSIAFSPDTTISVRYIVSADKPIDEPNNQLPVANPSSQTFAAGTGNLQGSFALSSAASTTGIFNIQLFVSGSSSYSNTSTTVQLISTLGPLPAPTVTSVLFADNAVSVFVLFDVSTDQGGFNSTSFACSNILTFVNATISFCSWVNSSAIRISFGNSPVSVASYRLSVGDSVQFLSSIQIRAKCLLGTECSANAYLDTSLTYLVEKPRTDLIPTVILVAPSEVGACNSSVLIDASASTGSGGRPWSIVSWTVLNDNGVNIPAMEGFLEESSAYQPITIPGFLFEAAASSQYVFALQLQNFLSFSSSAIAIVTLANPNIPQLKLNGGNSFTFLAADTVVITATASVSECLGTSSIISYTQEIREVTTGLLSISSVSADPRTFKLNPYTLSPGTYSVSFFATSPAVGVYVSVTTTKSATFTISTGNVIALITGGSTRTVSLSRTLNLDASSSYDENFPPGSSTVLSYAWSCVILSANNFGQDCVSVIQSSTRSSSSAIIPPLSLTKGLAYAFTVSVLASDERSSAASVTVIADSLSIDTEITTTTTVFNADANIAVDGMIFGNTSTFASWTVFSGSNVMTTSSLTPLSSSFSASEIVSGLSFPISFPPFTFTAGLSYTFRLSAYAVENATRISSAEISILINTPPSSGIVAISPSSGDALSVFLITAQGWIASTSFPLEYVFTYFLSSDTPELTIGSRKRQAFTSAALPAGFESNAYLVTVRGVIIDYYNASSNSTAQATVTPSFRRRLDDTSVTDATTALTFYLNTTVNGAFDSFNIDDAIVAVNVVSTSITSVNCSITTPSYCADVNRNPCRSRSNTCGTCLSTYPIGVPGQYNSLCSSSSSFRSNVNCSSNADCYFNLCVSGTCQVPSKTCPNSCSGQGVCLFTDASGTILSECLQTNTNCFARCSCSEGYGGSDCSLTPDALTARDNLRYLLCDSIVNINVRQDATGGLLDALIGALFQSFSVDEAISSVTQDRCLTAYERIVVLSQDGLLADTLSNTPSFLIEVLSSFLESDIFLSLQSQNSSSNASNITDLVVKGLLATMTNGQSPLSFITDYLQLSTSRSRISSLSDGYKFLVPASSSQVDFASNAQFIEFENEGLAACESSSGYAQTSITQYNRIPFNPSADTLLRNGTILNPLLKFTYLSTSSSTSRRRRLQSRTEILDFTPLFYVTLQFSTTQDFNFSQNWLARDRSLFPFNQTISVPSCANYDTGVEDFLACSGCSVFMYTNDNVSFACSDISLLCPASSETDSRRRLQSTTITGSESTTTSIFGALTQTFVNIISTNPFTLSSDRAISVLAFIATLSFVLLFGSFIFMRWDRLDHDYIIYVKKDDKLIQIDKTLKISHQEEKALKQGFDKNFRSRNRFASTSWLTSYLSFSSVSKATKPAAPSKTETVYEKSVKNFTDDILQAEYLLEKRNTIELFLRALLIHHDFLSPFFGYSLRDRRVIRWTKMAYSILVNVFIDTLFFQTFYHDNNQCERNSSQTSCLSGTNSATGERLCQWSVDLSSAQGGECSLNQPPTSVIFIVIVALLTLVISVPLEILADILLKEIASKHPDLEQFGWSNFYWFGTVTGDINQEHGYKSKSLQRQTSRGLKYQSSSSVNAFALDENLYEINLNAKRSYYDYMSVDEEVRELIAQVQSFLSDSRPEAYIPWLNPTTKYGHISLKHYIKLHAITTNLGITANGKTISLTTRQRLLYRSPYQRLVAKINHARYLEERMKRSLQNISKSSFKETQLLNEYLIQSFVLEHIPFFKRYCLSSIFFQHDEISPDTIDPFLWLLAWMIIIALCIFFVYWILAWAVSNQGSTIYSWGIVFLIAQLQDIFFVQTIRIYICYVASLQSTRQQLIHIYRVINNVALRISSESSILEVIAEPVLSNKHLSKRLREEYVELVTPPMIPDDPHDSLRVIQHFLPSCRVAKIPKYSHLFACRVLRAMDDVDNFNCRIRDQISVGFIAFLFLLIPSILFSIPDLGQALASAYINSVLPGAATGIITGNSYFFSARPTGLIITYSILGAAIFYYFLFYRPTVHRHIKKLQKLQVSGMMTTRELTRWFYGQPGRSWFTAVKDIAGDLHHRLTIESIRGYFTPDDRATKAWRHLNRSSAAMLDPREYSSLFDIALPGSIMKLLPPQKLIEVPSIVSNEKKSSLVDQKLYTTQEYDCIISGETAVASTTQVYENILTKQGPVAIYRHVHITENIDEALRRLVMLLYLASMNSEDAIDFLLSDDDDLLLSLPMQLSTELVHSYSATHTLAEYFLVMEKIWLRFHPVHQPVVREEADEIIESLIDYTKTRYERVNGIMPNEMKIESLELTFDEFARWYRHIVRVLVNHRRHRSHIPSFQSKPFQYTASPFYAIRDASTTTAAAAASTVPESKAKTKKAVTLPPMETTHPSARVHPSPQPFEAKSLPSPASVKSAASASSSSPLLSPRADIQFLSTRRFLSSRSPRSMNSKAFYEYAVKKIVTELHQRCELSSATADRDEYYLYEDISLIFRTFREQGPKILLAAAQYHGQDLQDHRQLEESLLTWYQANQMKEISIHSFIEWLYQLCKKITTIDDEDEASMMMTRSPSTAAAAASMLDEDERSVKVDSGKIYESAVKIPQPPSHAQPVFLTKEDRRKSVEL
jgi:hypothetical protein